MTPLEKHIADVWATELGFQFQDADADFFERGGNSFQAAAVVMQLRRALGVQIPLRYIFTQPTTIRGLAAQIEVLRWHSEDAAPSGQAFGARDEGEL
jgi:acyl carrier protein